MYGMGVFEQISIDVTGIEPVVTCGLEGLHSDGSFHPLGKAVDFRRRYYSDEQAKEILRRFNIRLDKNFDLILESDHFHLEHDVKY